MNKSLATACDDASVPISSGDPTGNVAVRKAAQQYIAAGWRIVPVPRGEKAPNQPDWPNIVWHVESIDGNVGVILGHVSKNLVDVDLDSHWALSLAPHFLPPTVTFGRASKPRSHWLYYSEGLRSQRFPFERAGKVELVELRGQNASNDRCGHQSVFPGSVHASGEPILWTEDEADEIVTLERGALIWATTQLSVACVIADGWVEGSQRNNKCRSWAAGLLAMGWSAEETRHLFEAVFEVAEVEEAQAHNDLAGIQRTIEAFQRGDKLQGFGTLVRDGLVAQSVVRRVEMLARTPDTLATEAKLARAVIGVGLRDRIMREAQNTDALGELQDQTSLLFADSTVPPDALVDENAPAPARHRLEAAEPEGGERAGCDPVVDRVIEHLATAACGVFQRSGKLVIVTRDARDDGDVIRPEGAPTIRELVPARLKEIIRTTASPREASLAVDVLARGEWSHIRPLDAIVSFPVIRRDGSLLLASGYDGLTRTLAEMTVRVDVPEAPTQDDARTALALLNELVSDFPFAGEAQRAAWLAMLLTVPARPAIDGPTPLGLLEATQRGSGKSLLADVISTIVTGEVASRRVAPKTREEWDKVLFSILLAGDPLVLFDNVTNMLVSDALDAVLTGTVYSQRLLGVSEDRRVAIRTVFLVSANNARLSTDLVRRSLGCRLEPAVEQPETRTGFRVSDLLGHVRRERSRYLSAALTVLRAYVVAGRPRVTARPMGSYEAWCRVVRDPLVWAGAADPAVTQDALRESADVERDELRDLLTAWHTVLGDRLVTVRELLDAAQTGRVPGIGPERSVGGKFARPPSDGGTLLDALRGVTPNGAEPTTHTIGNRLRTMRGQIVGGLVLREGRRARGDRATYQVLGVVT